eukprot:TRINITY_DN7151_c1_g1_i4.p1 TRINITY_DN7151_c1_g1~~TRINITY_DN7151_c1_g1_i4.p1  ORF type:complete len:362 (-),score=61.31 TRINITY_DN7151_c1_g1_i4:307-1392(-)
MTDLLGTPSLDTISRVRNEKARKYLNSMRKKQPVPFAQKFPNADPLALGLLQRLLAFDPKDRPTAEEALADPYFKGLAKVEREPSCQPITKLEFEFERRKVTKEDIRELIFREILEYHPQLRKDYINGTEGTNFLYPSAIDQFRKQFAHLEDHGGRSGPVIPLERKHVSLPRSTVVHSNTIPPREQPTLASFNDRNTPDSLCKNSRDTDVMSGNILRTLPMPQRLPLARPGKVVGPVFPYDTGSIKDAYDPRRLIRNNNVLLSNTPQPSIPMPAYCFPRSTAKPERPERDTAELGGRGPSQTPCTTTAKLAPDVAIDISASPFYLSQVAKADPVQAKSPFGGIRAAHRKVGTVQYGMSRMY